MKMPGSLAPDHSRNYQALGLTVLGGLARLIPHPANFTPVGGMSLFAGARLRGWRAYLVPVVLMAVTDPLLSRVHGFSAFDKATPFIYASFLMNVWIGRRLLRDGMAPARLAFAVLLCSLQFFVITNAVWFQIGGTYPHTWAGFLASYVAGLPFFGRTLAGDLSYAGLLFGLDAWLKRSASRSQEPTQATEGSAA